MLNSGVLLSTEASSQEALGHWTGEVESRRTELTAIETEHRRQLDIERTVLADAGDAQAANRAKANKQPLRKYLAAGEAARESVKQLSVLRTAADSDEVDPDSPVLLPALGLLLSDAYREIADRNVRLASLKSDRGTIIETGLAGRNADVDVVVRALQMAGVRSARPNNTYVADTKKNVAEARSLVLSDPARFLGVSVASAEWARAGEVLGVTPVKLSAPVTVSVSALDAAAPGPDKLVLGPQDDAAYNREAAKAVLTMLASRIAEQDSALRAYEQRRDEAVDARSSLTTYQTEYGQAKLAEARAQLELLDGEEKAALLRQSELLAQARTARITATGLADRLIPASRKVTDGEKAVEKIESFIRDHETPREERLARIGAIDGLLAAQAAKADELSNQLADAELAVRNAREDRQRNERAMQDLADERAGISHYDKGYPADEQLRAKLVGLDTLRGTYKDAVSTLETAERDRLGVLAEKLKHARNERETAQTTFNAQYAALKANQLEPYRNVDFEGALRDQHAQVERQGSIERAADNAVATAKAERNAFWKTQKVTSSATPDMKALDDAALQARIAETDKERDHLENTGRQANEEAIRARREAETAQAKANHAQTLHDMLKAAVAFEFSSEDLAVLGEDADATVNLLISNNSSQGKQLKKLRESADKAFRELVKAASAKELVDIEPELARDIAESEFEAACADRLRVLGLIEDRLYAARDILAGMVPDFENSVGELYNLAYEGMALLNRACDKRMPETTPYVGGKPILKMKVAFTGVGVEARKAAIRQYLNTLIDTGQVPAKGADLVAQCLVAMSGRPDLGLQVLKMEQNESYQYQIVGDLKGSRGQGTVIAMFLYLLISQLRADTQARAKRGGGGPLILDNPFAKVQTRALIDAQRLLAKEIGVQLIFFTANADYNMLVGFRRIVRLRKSGAHSKTGRSHIELVSATFEELPESEEAFA